MWNYTFVQLGSVQVQFEVQTFRTSNNRRFRRFQNKEIHRFWYVTSPEHHVRLGTGNAKHEHSNAGLFWCGSGSNQTPPTCTLSITMWSPSRCVHHMCHRPSVILTLFFGVQSRFRTKKSNAWCYTVRIWSNLPAWMISDKHKNFYKVMQRPNPLLFCLIIL